MSKPIVCPYCHSTAIDFGVSGGVTTCMNCSRVIEETVIINNVEFIESTGGSSNVVGQFVNETGSFFSSSGSRYTLKESREITINNGKRKISQYAAALNLQSYVESAHKIFVLAVQQGFTQGRRTSHVCATCLYVICRWENSPVMLIDFADFLQTNIWSLGAVFMKLNSLLHLGVKPIDPSLYLHRFASQMDFGDQTNKVTLTALRLTKRMQRDWIVRGRRPLGIIAAALLLAARMNGFKRSKQEVLSIVRVCDETLRNRLREFGNTAAGSLSIEEFNALAYQTNDFEVDEEGNNLGDDGIVSSYPPSFIRNRLKDDELVKSIAQIQSEEGLTEEEALLKLNIITPGSHYQIPNRNKNKTKKDSDYEDLYSNLENEMKEIMKSMDVTPDGELPNQEEDPSSTNTNQEDSTSTKNPNKEKESLSETIKNPEESKETKKIKLKQTGAVESSIRVYSGRRMRLEEQTVLPNGGIKQSWVPVDINEKSESDPEIDGMMLDEEEQKKKSELWEAENREWLNEKEKKRKERESNQHVTRKRQKRRFSSAYHHPVKTAEEGIKKLIEAKKISSKVNYAAVKNLFD